MLGTGRGRSARAAAMAALTGAAVAVTMMAGCGTVRAGKTEATPKVAGRLPAARTAGTGPIAGSAKQAQRLADELLSRLVLPAGTHPVPWHPPPVLQQTGIALGVPHQADVHRLWLVPKSMPALAGYIRAHPPAGLPFQGFGQAGSGGQITSEQTTFFMRSPPAGIEQAQLVLEIAPAGQNHSTLRADGEVIWYPPRSAAEYLAPARFHAVTVAASFLNPKPHVVRRTFTSPAVIARLARFLNSLPATPGGLVGCPMVSSSYSLAFRSSAAARPYLTATTSACGSVGITVNGRTQPGLADPQALIIRAITAALAGHPSSLAPASGPTTPAPAPVTSLPLPAKSMLPPASP